MLIVKTLTDSIVGLDCGEWIVSDLCCGIGDYRWTRRTICEGIRNAFLFNFEPTLSPGKYFLSVGAVFGGRWQVSVVFFLCTCVQEGRLSGGWFPDTGDDDVFHSGACLLLNE